MLGTGIHRYVVWGLNDAEENKKNVCKKCKYQVDLFVYLSDEPGGICKHMVIDISVLDCHGPVLVVSVNDQGQSYREWNREKDIFPGDLLHQQPDMG